MSTDQNTEKKRIAIIGSGPAGLMAASVLARDPFNEIHLFERRPGFGRKLLVAGSSGLNISHHASAEAFAHHYQGWTKDYWKQLFKAFSPEQWIQFIEKELGLETFLGTSDRYFVREMKASNLLKKWTTALESQGVTFHSKMELTEFYSDEGGVALQFNGESEFLHFDRACFFLGGGSWEETEPTWFELFKSKDISLRAFEPSNVGYNVAWSPEFLKEAEGKPLKKIIFTSKTGEKAGELVVTQYGLEGTPVYFFGNEGEAYLDLKPDLTIAQILEKCADVKENLSPMRRVKQKLSLCEASLALVFHYTPPDIKSDLKKLATRIKRFPIQLLTPRPLLEAISSKGGVKLNELSNELELKKFKNVYCGGEMLDWDAPTGGFLIQAAISQGAWIGQHASS
jgi:uncharacterized flavoprotein (TIGR03862 family)